MPPKAKPRPSDEEQRAVFDWIGKKEAARRAREGRVVLRRLNRQEYTNTVGDLMGVETDFRDLLALDGTADGFDNVGAALHLSSFALDRYLDAARSALDLGIANRPAPPVAKKRSTFNKHHMVTRNDGGYFRVLEDETVVHFITGNGTALWFPDFYPTERGYYRIRICASAFQSEGKPVTFSAHNGSTGLVGYFDVPADTPTVIEYVVRAEARTGGSIHTYGLGNEVTKVPGNAKAYKGKGLAIHWMETEGPLYESWPPAGHRAIFGDLPQAKVGGHLEVVSKDPIPDAERILRSFTRRAFRRSVSDEDIRPYVALVKARLEAKDTFEAGGPRRPHGRDDVHPVPLPAREAGQARRLRPGLAAVLLLLEHDARRGVARAGGEGEAVAAGDASRPGRADDPESQGGGLHQELLRPMAGPPRHRSTEPTTTSTRSSTTC